MHHKGSSPLEAHVRVWPDCFDNPTVMAFEPPAFNLLLPTVTAASCACWCVQVHRLPQTRKACEMAACLTAVPLTRCSKNFSFSLLLWNNTACRAGSAAFNLLGCNALWAAPGSAC
jgi:hypothetical protein